MNRRDAIKGAVAVAALPAVGGVPVATYGVSPVQQLIDDMIVCAEILEAQNIPIQGRFMKIHPDLASDREFLAEAKRLGMEVIQL